jgi:hypothetical protein
MIIKHDDTAAVLSCFFSNFLSCDLHLYISARGVLRHGYALMLDCISLIHAPIGFNLFRSSFG